MDSISPYSELPRNRFWKTGVSEQVPNEVVDLYKKKFQISPQDKIAAAGSCFAQHISRQLRLRGFNVMDVEPAPLGLTGANAQRFGYQLYSARYGNIYHMRQLLQLAREANGDWTPDDCIWEKNGRYFDSLRPSVEPSGLARPETVEQHRKSHLRHVQSLFKNADVFVFTFGLTEAWVHRASGTVFPTAPGTIAGSYDESIYEFKNFGFSEIYSDFLEFRDLLKSLNPNIRFLLTISPVPLIATASCNHVLVATTYSKSVLRAVAGQLCEAFPDVDYFPSYELITSPFSRSMFYHDNMRSVTESGVENVMRVFFSEHGDVPVKQEHSETVTGSNMEDVVCEEILLEVFGK